MPLNATQNVAKREAKCIMMHIVCWVIGLRLMKKRCY